MSATTEEIHDELWRAFDIWKQNELVKSAAPEMLSALKECIKAMDVLEGMTSSRGDDDWIWGLQKQVNSAISKAEGK